MISRTLAVTTPSLALAGLLALGGCLQNPGDDPDLNKPRPTVQKATVELTFRQANFLQLFVENDSDRTRLRVANTGLNKVDSASFLLQIGDGDKPGDVNDPFPASSFQFLGTVMDLEPGATREFGVIDTLHDFPSLTYRTRGWLLAVRENGNPKGSAFAGLFTGTYIQWEQRGVRIKGRIRSLINADGDFTFSTYDGTGYPGPLYSIWGTLKDDGVVAIPFRVNAYRQTGKSGRVTAQDGRYLARFDFVDSISTYDSLEIRYESAIRR